MLACVSVGPFGVRKSRHNEERVHRRQSARGKQAAMTSREEAWALGDSALPVCLFDRKPAVTERLNPARGFLWALLISGVLWLAVGVLVAALV
jgi:hypothetical protein